MPDEYGGMSISDWDSSKLAVKKHLGVMLAKDPNYQGVFETLLIHLIVDIFMVKECPKNMSANEFISKYTQIFQEGLGININSLDTDKDA